MINNSTPPAEKRSFRYSPRLLITYFVLGFAYPGIIGLVYMQYVYYDAMILVMDISNTQLGLLMTIEALGAVFLALPCGILIDRFDCKKVMALSLAATALGCAIFAFNPTYKIALVAWTVFAVTMCGFYPAIYKVVRIIAPESRSGSSFGIFGVCNAIGFMTVNFISLKTYSVIEASSGPAAGMSAVLWIFFGVLVCAGLIGYLLVRSVKNPDHDVTQVDKFSFKDIKTVFKMPGTWLVFIIGFVINSQHISMSYFTPYFTSVLGTAVVFSGVLAVIRQYGMRVISSPLGGWYGDRLQSNSKVIIFGLVIASCLIAAIMLLPSGVAVWSVVLLVMALALMDNMTISLCYSIFGEALIPPRYMGTVIGVITIILPDLFVPAMFGFWLDNFGNGGYPFIFLFTIALNVLGIIAAYIVIRRYKKHKAEYDRKEDMLSAQVQNN